MKIKLIVGALLIVAVVFGVLSAMTFLDDENILLADQYDAAVKMNNLFGEEDNLVLEALEDEVSAFRTRGTVFAVIAGLAAAGAVVTIVVAKKRGR